LSKGSLWRFRMVNDEVESAEELLMQDRHRTRKVVVSPAGKIYLLTDENNGKIIRLQPTS
ncbi:MAG: PQQ-dependent sugar dehydrogenase, partial [Bacteroidota bacterium]